MASENAFSGNYMILRAERLTLYDAIATLFSRNLWKRKFVDSPYGKEEPFSRRVLILACVLMELVLGYMALPMAFLGLMAELSLNLISCNGGVRRLILNILRGKVVIPYVGSESFLSTCGHLDTRKELDGKIKPGDNRYEGALAMMAAKASYENRAYIETVVTKHWKMDFLGAYDFWNDFQEKYATQGFMMRDTSTKPETIIVAFRGTEPFNADDWCSDIDMSWFEIPQIPGVRIHAGFMKALGLQKKKGWPKEIAEDITHHMAYYFFRNKLRELLKNSDAKFVVTGHSLGGALAILFPSVMAIHEEAWLLDRLEAVHTFGQPRVGNKQFGDYMTQQFMKYNVKYIRHVYCNDMVPRVPFDDHTFLFKHFGTCVYYNSLYQGKIVKDHPNQNYISMLAAIPMRINAVWEIMRAFILPFTKGRDYKEGRFMVSFRMLGLLLPGLPAHTSQDYVNSTRLASVATSK